MQKKAHAVWVIFLTFFISYLLAIVPFPEWAMDYRPEWVPMVLMYWVMALPYRVGIGSAWVAGIVLDVLEGSVLGLNALGLVVIAYITLNLHQRLRMFSSLMRFSTKPLKGMRLGSTWSNAETRSLVTITTQSSSTTFDSLNCCLHARLWK